MEKWSGYQLEVGGSISRYAVGGCRSCHVFNMVRWF